MSINPPEKDPEWERLECLTHFEQAHKLRIEKLMSRWSFQLSHRTHQPAWLLPCNDFSVAWTCFLHHHRLFYPLLINWEAEMADHIRILNDELYRTCDYDHRRSRSQMEAPPFLQLSCSVALAPQYRLDWGHGKRHLRGGSGDLTKNWRRMHWSFLSKQDKYVSRCKNTKHVSLIGSYSTYSCLDTV